MAMYNTTRVSFTYVPAIKCEICNGKSNIIVSGHRVCGKCLKAGRVLDMLQDEQAAKNLDVTTTVTFSNSEH